MAEANGGENSTSHSSLPVQFLETPEGRKLAYRKSEGSSPGVVFVHGLCSTMNGQKASALETLCLSKGHAFVSFDLSGHGQSSEKFKECNITMWLEDLDAVFNSLTKGEQVIVGSSLGGWLMFLYTMRNPDKVCGLIGVSTAADFTQHLWSGLSKEDQQQVKKTGVYKMTSLYSDEPYDLTLQLIQDGDKYSILDMPGIEYIKVPTWLFHGGNDTIVPINTSLQIMHRLQCQVSLETVEDGNHRLSRPQDLKLIEDVVLKIFDPTKNEASRADSSSELDDD